MPLIDATAAVALLARWRDGRALLRVRAEMSPVVFDLEGVLGRVEPPFVALVVKDRGTAEVLLEGEWKFTLGEPDGGNENVSAAVGKSSSDKKQYEFGETLVAFKRDGSNRSILFMEILGQII